MDVPAGWMRIERDEVDSTQELARELLRGGATAPLAVVARTQRAGRGRRGRRWESPAGGLWLSAALPVRPPADPFLGLLAALAAQEAVGAALDPEERAQLSLLWPNDLVIGDRKWGGVLGEVETAPSGGLWLIIGIGLDLAVPAEKLPRTAPPALRATSILVEFGRSPSPVQVLPRILSRLEERLALDRSPGGRERSVGEVAAALSTLGRRVRWREGDRTGEGRAIGLAADGGLAVEIDDPGSFAPDGPLLRILRAGEIEHLR
jgi:BirA family biotin operon repressor/biotin-[acetyl-CoA-carboxylase] ligase